MFIWNVAQNTFFFLCRDALSKYWFVKVGYLTVPTFNRSEQVFPRAFHEKGPGLEMTSSNASEWYP